MLEKDSHLTGMAALISINHFAGWSVGLPPP